MSYFIGLEALERDTISWQPYIKKITVKNISSIGNCWIYSVSYFYDITKTGIFVKANLTDVICCIYKDLLF